MGFQKYCYFGGYIHIPTQTSAKIIKVKSCPNKHENQTDSFCSICGSVLTSETQTVRIHVDSHSILKELSDDIRSQWIVHDELICFNSRSPIDSYVDLHHNDYAIRSSFLTSENLKWVVDHIKTKFNGIKYSVGFGPYVVWR